MFDTAWNASMEGRTFFMDLYALNDDEVYHSTCELIMAHYPKPGFHGQTLTFQENIKKTYHFLISKLPTYFNKVLYSWPLVTEICRQIDNLLILQSFLYHENSPQSGIGDTKCCLSLPRFAKGVGRSKNGLITARVPYWSPRPVVTTIFTRSVCTSVRPPETFENLAKQNKFQESIVITTGRIVGLAERIIDDPHVLLGIIRLRAEDGLRHAKDDMRPFMPAQLMLLVADQKVVQVVRLHSDPTGPSHWVVIIFMHGVRCFCFPGLDVCA